MIGFTVSLIIMSLFPYEKEIKICVGEDSRYFAARYTIGVNVYDSPFPDGGMPIMGGSNTYFIQYGEDKLIRITEPDKGMPFPVVVRKWDYKKKNFSSTMIMHYVQKYYIQEGPLRFSIEEKRGSVENYCNSNDLTAWCDSVKYTSTFNGAETVLYFDEKIPNLKSEMLLYPDIKFLPSKIVRLNSNIKTKVLEEVFEGKVVIDSILQQFTYEGYEQITQKEMDSLFLAHPPSSFLPSYQDSGK